MNSNVVSHSSDRSRCCRRCPAITLKCVIGNEIDLEVIEQFHRFIKNLYSFIVDRLYMSQIVLYYVKIKNLHTFKVLSS